MENEIQGLRELVAQQAAKIETLQNENAELKSTLISTLILLDKSLVILDEALYLVANMKVKN